MARTKNRLVRESDTIEISPQGCLLEASLAMTASITNEDPRGSASCV